MDDRAVTPGRWNRDDKGTDVDEKEVAVGECAARSGIAQVVRQHRQLREASKGWSAQMSIRSARC